MWSERPDMTLNLFNTYTHMLRSVNFHTSMWSERPDMTWDMLNTYINANKC